MKELFKFNRFWRRMVQWLLEHDKTNARALRLMLWLLKKQYPEVTRRESE